MDKIAADVETKPAPEAAPAPAPTTGAGVQTVTRYLHTQSNPDPLYVETVIMRHPAERAAIIALLQQTCGNGFVQRVMAVPPMKLLPDQTPPVVATTPDGMVVDGGILGPLTSSTATAKADVNLPSIETVVTMANGQLAMTFTAVVPFSDMHAGDVKPADLAQVTNVTKIGGVGGTIAYELVAGGIRLTLAGAPSTKALATTGFKLWLASGETVLVSLHAKTFHTDIGEMDRTDTRNEIANMQQAVGSTTKQLAQERASGKYKPADIQFVEKELADQQGHLAQDQATLAKQQGPDFVTLDEDGAQMPTAH